MTGRVIIVSAPAGTGKTTLVQMLKKNFPAQVVQTISCTTRDPRAGEVDGKDYFFLDQKSFEEKLRNGEFLEHAVVFGHSYGTLKENVVRERAAGRHVILVIDTQGALELKKKIKATLIFIAPPSLDVLERRLRDRQTESFETLKQRLEWAKEEMKQVSHYDYIVINDDLKTAYRELEAIVIGQNHSKGGRKMRREELTKESYDDLFEDNFQLTHYTIKVARDRIRDGDEDLSVVQLLREIRKTIPKRPERNRPL